MPAVSPRKLSNSAFTSSAWVHVTQCGPSFTTSRRAPLMSLAVRSPVAVMGRMRSASPLNHQRRHIYARQVLAKVFVPGLDAREAGGSGGAGRNVPTGLDDLFADTLSQEYVGVEEIS